MSIAAFKDYFSKATDNFIADRRHDYLAQLQDLEWRREAIEARLEILNSIVKERKSKQANEVSRGQDSKK